MSIDTTPRIQSIRVTELFGLYNHLITLKEDRVTVIHGPNGVGKTVFLKLVNSFLLGQYSQIARVPFENFEVVFGDSSSVTMRMESASTKSRRMHLAFRSTSGAVEEKVLEGDLLSSRKIASQIADMLPYISQIGPDQWLDRRTDEYLDADEVIDRNGSVLPQNNRRSAWEPKGLRKLRLAIPVHFIEAQRLIRVTSISSEWRFRGSERTTTATVQEYSDDLKQKLETALANYAKQSQKLDQTFPQRLLQGSIKPLSLQDLKAELQNIEITRNKLKEIGILDNGDPSQDPYPLQISQLDSLQEGQLSVMSVYVQDTREKLSVLGELSGRIEILLGILERKFTNKRVSISRESGLAIIGKDEKTIPITALSSGEQHELVLLYDLLFKVKPNTLVLIDEPELSLHISWQKGFLDDLLGIIKLAHFDVLMATHSPYIVGDRSDLLVVLSSENKNNEPEHAN